MAGGKIMLEISKELFQWEKGRKVFVGDPEITIIGFYNKKSKQTAEVKVIDGQAQIPNELMTQNLPITALACVEDEDGTKVMSRKTFKVLARPKPETYVEPEEPDVPDEPDTPDTPDIPGVDIIYDGGRLV
jgi:hypothetical protein